MSLLQDGAHWRELAKEIRAIARKLDDPQNEGELVAIAEMYEAMAERADARVTGHPLSRKA
jgi:hypothetical protein